MSCCDIVVVVELHATRPSSLSEHYKTIPSPVMSLASVRKAPSGGQTSNTGHSLETGARWDQGERVWVIKC